MIHVDEVVVQIATDGVEEAVVEIATVVVEIATVVVKIEEVVIKVDQTTEVVVKIKDAMNKVGTAIEPILLKVTDVVTEHRQDTVRVFQNKRTVGVHHTLHVLRPYLNQLRNRPLGEQVVLD